MRNQPPCVTWAEKLALRREDLSPADREAVDAHVQTCPACEAAQADYHFLDSHLQALPPPALKPLPRLSLQNFRQDEGERDSTKMMKAGGATSASRLSSPVKRRTTRGRFVFFVGSAFRRPSLPVLFWPRYCSLECNLPAITVPNRRERRSLPIMGTAIT